MKLRSALLVLLLAAATAVVMPVSATAASVDGVNVHWTSTGAGAHTLVFVHGWTCDETSWSAQVPALSKKYRVITLDLPGHGKSGMPKGGAFSMDLFARAVEAVRSEAKADRLVLVGHSMGTPVIRQYARLYPQHVAALVLVDGVVALGAPPRPGVNALAPPQPEQMRGPGGLKARETMIRGMFLPSTPKPIQDHVLKMMLGAPEATAYGAMTATFDPAIWKETVVLTMPALGLFADKSALGNPDATRKVLPNLEYHEIPGTGHFLMMEKPAEFNRLLERFVDALPAAGARAQGIVTCAPVPQATLDANKQLLIDFFDSGRTMSREERSRRFQADNYIQHNPRALRIDEFTGAKGRDAWVKAFDEAARRKVALVDLGGIALRDPIIVMAECDLVTAIYKGVLKDPDDPNRTYEAFAFETVRVKDGKFTEHWDQVTLSPGWMKGTAAR